MIYFYLSCFIMSFVLFLWQNISDERQSVTQHNMLIILIIANGGYLALAVATNLHEAVLANKLLYTGGCFMPMLYFITVCEICRVNINRKIIWGMYILQIILFAGVCTIGWNQLYYRSVEFHLDSGIPYLTKEYGVLHMLYPVTMCGYFILAFIVVTYTLLKKQSVNRKGIMLMLICFLLAISCYIFERMSGSKIKVMPLAYVVLMTGSVGYAYQSNLFTIEENKSIINEQLSEVGFISFDRKMRYMGCNAFAEKIFPQFCNYAVGSKIKNPDIFLQKNIIDKVRAFAESIPSKGKNVHKHIKLGTLELDDHSYDYFVHTILNYRGKYVGYTVEINDETEHYKALELFTNYNRTLTKDVENKTRKIREMQEKVILGMAQMVESRDLSTGGHIKRTSEVVKIFSEELLKNEMGFDEKFLQLVVRSAPMHDLGKIGVDDAVLRKQGKFTDEEYEKMKKHAEIGARMVKEILTDVEEEQFVKIAINVAHYHHEKVNGRGYPQGLKGNEIPIEARIMALADVFDALVSKRCYKEAFSFDKAFTIIKEDSGVHFDAALAEIFLKCRPKLEEFYINYNV